MVTAGHTQQIETHVCCHVVLGVGKKIKNYECVHCSSRAALLSAARSPQREKKVVCVMKTAALSDTKLRYMTVAVS